MGDHLGEHRVEVEAHHRTRLHAGVPADRGLRRRGEGGERAGGREEPGSGVLGVEAGLDGVAAERDRLLLVAERLAGGDAQLLADQVDARDLLGDRVLDLQPGVDLEEEELVGGVVDQELDGAGRPVAEGAGQAQRGVAHGGAQVGVDDPGDGDSSMIFWWRRWIEHSRSPRCTSPPWASPRIWISTWRARAT